MDEANMQYVPSTITLDNYDLLRLDGSSLQMALTLVRKLGGLVPIELVCYSASSSIFVTVLGERLEVDQTDLADVVPDMWEDDIDPIALEHFIHSYVTNMLEDREANYEQELAESKPWPMGHREDLEALELSEEFSYKERDLEEL